MRTKAMRIWILALAALLALAATCPVLAENADGASGWTMTFGEESESALDDASGDWLVPVEQIAPAVSAPVGALVPVGDIVPVDDIAPVPEIAPVEQPSPSAPSAPAEKGDPAGEIGRLGDIVSAGEISDTESPAPVETPAPEPTAEAAPALRGAFEAAPTLEPPQPLRHARIRAVGDLMVHKKQLAIARQSDGSYDFHPQYALIADSLADADYTVANLETTIGKYRDLDYSGFPMFNTPESLLDAVRDAGVDFLTLANNHMLDRYFEGMVNTVNNVEQYGFNFGGANRSPEERDAANVVRINGIGVGFLCYTQMTNGMEKYCTSDATEYGVNYLRKADFAADVQKLRDAGADVVIALPHWGEEYNRKPEPNTVALAKLMIASGVDVILGSHPHMVQPVEFVEAETADGGKRTGLVAYSMGNFISNMSVWHTETGIIVDFTIQERQDGSFGIDNVGCVPVFCWRQSDSIRSISSLKYLDEAPEGMDSQTYRNMRQSYSELRELLGSGVAMLAE